MSKNDCCAGLVKLDLDEMIQICEIAINNSRNEMERERAIIDDHLTDANSPDITQDENFRHLCNANTHTDYFLRASKQYAKSVSMYFFLVEASKRPEIEIIRE